MTLLQAAREAIMAAAQATIEWEAEPDYRGTLASLCGRFIIGPWEDDDRYRYELVDRTTGRIAEYGNSYSECQQWAEPWLANPK
jgi:hypothetical protein